MSGWVDGCLGGWRRKHGWWVDGWRMGGEAHASSISQMECKVPSIILCTRLFSNTALAWSFPASKLRRAASARSASARSSNSLARCSKELAISNFRNKWGVMGRRGMTQDLHKTNTGKCLVGLELGSNAADTSDQHSKPPMNILLTFFGRSMYRQ